MIRDSANGEKKECLKKRIIKGKKRQIMMIKNNSQENMRKKERKMIKLDDAEKGQLQKYDKNEERKHENLDNEQSWKYEKREIKLCMITRMIK